MKIISFILLSLVLFPVFSQYDTQYDIHKIATALEEQNRQRQIDEMRWSTERTLDRMAWEREQQRLAIERHRNYFYSAIERAVPDARAIINSGDFRSWLVKNKITDGFKNAMVPVAWKKRKKWIMPIYLEPDNAIRILVAYKKYSSVKENEIRKRETDNAFFQAQMQKVKRVHPDAMIIMNDPKFLKWLDTQSVMKSVFENTNDPVDIIPILDAYKKFLLAENIRKKEHQKKILSAKMEKIEKERISKFYNEIEKRHPNAVSTMQSPDFKKWIKNQNVDVINTYHTTMNSDSICKILDMYEMDLQDKKIKDFQSKAEAGITEAQYALGELYEKKAEQNPSFFVQAHMWYNIASSSGSNLAPGRVMIIEKKMSKEDKEKAISLCFEWMDKHKNRKK